MKNSSGGGGVSVLTVIGVVFIILKLVGTINWPWLWVLAPFWIPFMFVGLLIFFFAICLLVDYAKNKRM